MSFSNKIILLILSTITLIFVTEESQRTIPSEEEIKELRKQLNHINKPPIKSFQTKHSYILDCVDINKQLAFDHPLLKNHTIQLKPTTLPKWTKDNNKTSQDSISSMPFLQVDDITCPKGTVIIKRATLEDLIQAQRLKRPLGPKYATSSTNKYGDLTGHHYAIVEYSKENHGAIANINIWDPPVKSDQSSLASITIRYGIAEQHQGVSAGWMVSPILNQSHSALFTYYTAKGYNETGCYNTLCPGFVQVSFKFPLGTLASPVSIYNGQQYHLEVSIFQDGETKAWWFVVKGEPIGYWPSSLFTGGGLAWEADRVFWGGEVISLANPRMSPGMGSGYFPQEGYKKAAYMNGLKVLAKDTKVMIPKAKDLIPFTNTPTCYNLEAKSGDGDFWSRYFFYGGPGGCTIQ
ncbi:unnamed protein product [Cochlearia groenlandica]